MDFLKAEIDRKRKVMDDHGDAGSATSSNNGAPKKYMRKSEIQAAEAEAKRAAEMRSKETWQQRKERKLLEAATKVAKAEDAANATFASNEADESAVDDATKAESSKPEAFNISSAEAVRRLRAKGQPIRLFGESDKDRRLRLRALELIEERSEGQRNDFMRALEGADKDLDLAQLQSRTDMIANPAIARVKGAGSREGSAAPASDADEQEDESAADGVKHAKVDMSLVKSNPRKLYPQIYHGIKRMLKEWEQAMHERPENVKRSTQGKLAAATQAQSAEYLKPLFKSLRKRELEPDVLTALAEIVSFMQQREYLRANDSYLRLSIGNAPWPIGVTMVGIHERSAREKIFSNQVAHVLNDEVSRKYIQSLKRVLTFAQSKYPPEDLSQRMG